MNNSSRRPAIRQPSAMRSHTPKKVTFGLKPSETKPSEPKLSESLGKTPAQISEMKMAAMAEDPAAEIVYWTENGVDSKGWDIIFPEYKVLTDAFRGGYGWWDITEGKAQHLIPKQKPYKIVHITSAELKVIRAKESEAQAIAAAKAKASEEQATMLSLAKALAEKEQAACEVKEREAMAQAEREAKEREAMAQAAREAKAQAEREAKECALMAKEDAYSELIMMPDYVSFATNKIMKEIRLLGNDLLYQDYLVEFISNRLLHYKAAARNDIVTAVCEMVEDEKLLYVSTPSSHYVVEPPTPPTPPTPPQLPFVPLPHKYEDIKRFFDANPPFYHDGYKYLPFIHIDGRKLLVPEVYISYMLDKNIILYNPLPSILRARKPTLNVYDLHSFIREKYLYFADKVFVPSVTFDGRCMYIPWQSPVYALLPPRQSPPMLPTPLTQCKTSYSLPLIHMEIIEGPPPPNWKIIQTITLYPPRTQIVT